MPEATPRYYWESCPLVALIAGEPERADQCRLMLNEVRAGKHLAVTSALTFAEVIGKRNDPEHLDQKVAIDQMWLATNFVIIPVDRWIGQRAKYLRWDYGLSTQDAIHLATAMQHEASKLLTYDTHLLGLNGKFKGLAIVEPRVVQVISPELPGMETLPPPDQLY